MKHCCNNCVKCHYNLAEFSIEFKCGRQPLDLNMGCMDWAPFPPRGDKKVIIEVYRALKRGDAHKAENLLKYHLNNRYEGAEFWAGLPRIPEDERV